MTTFTKDTFKLCTAYIINTLTNSFAKLHLSFNSILINELLIISAFDLMRNSYKVFMINIIFN